MSQTQATSTPNPEAYIVITGSGGFIGARLAHMLKERHPEQPVLLVDTLEYFATRNCCEGFQDYSLTKFLSPTDFIIQLQKGMLKCEAVYHLGACSRTDETRESFLEENNFRYTQHIWNACCEQKIPLYYASSAATYGGGENGFDDDPALIPSLKPLNLYGWSKQKFDLFVLEEIEKGHTPPSWAGFKFFNVYGFGEEHKKNQSSVLLAAFHQFSKKGAMTLFRSHNDKYKDGEQLRDFVFVDDVCEALLEFGQHKLKSGIFNMGTGKARTFIDLAKACAAAMGKDCQLEWRDTPENLREHYQYFTEAKLERLREAGYTRAFTDLENGAKEFWRQLQEQG